MGSQKAFDKNLLKKKVARTKKIGILAMIFGWIPLLGWGLIVYTLFSSFRLLVYIGEEDLAPDIIKARNYGLVAMFLIPFELIITGAILLGLGV